MSWFVPVNRFSLHGMYRMRLIRTFLGASRRDRHPNGFTGFDAHDDVCVHELRDVRPLHVINATLNAVSSTHVGRHEKQSESFTFSPLHVGNHELGYRHAGEYGSDGGGKGTGISLGMALAVSGAAASPAMGMYSTKSRAFLLTLANARLGLWFGNPQDETTWQSSEPPLGVGPIMRELLGLTTDKNPLRLPVGRRPLREPRAVGDGGAALPLHHRVGRRVRSRSTRSTISRTPSAASGWISASRSSSIRSTSRRRARTTATRTRRSAGSATPSWTAPTRPTGRSSI